jgi:hypothetical protein
MAAQIYNGLPLEIRKTDNLKDFEKLLNEHYK